MGDRDSKASIPERRASVRTSRRISLQQHDAAPEAPEILDIGDDDYALLALGVVSDGYRPGPPDTIQQNNPPSLPPQPAARPDSDLALAQSSIAESSSTPSPPRPTRSSISKPPRTRESFTLRHDGPAGHVPGPSLSRVSSTSSDDTPNLVFDGPYQGPSGPSHPYQMYSQGIRSARTMSIATTSSTPTTRPESEYNGPTGPSHPYSMYPQNPVDTPAPHPPVPSIPVGFTNNADPYQRRLGPDGEEIADIIGPDGHTEELPPYTRYPDEHYARKIRATADAQRGSGGAAGPAAVPVVTMAAIPQGMPAPLPGMLPGAIPAAMPGVIPGAQPGQLAILPPCHISGAGGIGLAARNPEFDSRSIDDMRSPQSRHSSRSFATESHHEINTAAAAASEKPKLTRFQRFAKRKACGVVPYWAIGLTLIAIIIVIIVVGAVVGSIFSRHKPKNKGGSSNQYQDSVPVTITYDATPIATPSDLPALAQGTYGLPLNLNQSPNTCFNKTSQTSAWSCNIPLSEAIQMQITITRNAPQLGKDGNYDVSMISNATLGDAIEDGSTADGSLSYGASPPQIATAMSMELVNDTFDPGRGPAWFRMLPYNKTVLVQEDLLSASSNDKRAFNTIGGFQRKGVARSGDRPWLCTWPETFVEVFIYAEQNSSFASQTGTITATPTATATGTTSDTTATDAIVSAMPIQAYPRAIKVKERRVDGSPAPYCVQVEVQTDNTTIPVTDSDGNQIAIFIEENDEGSGNSKRDVYDTWLQPRSSNADMSDCGCMWFAS